MNYGSAISPIWDFLSMGLSGLCAHHFSPKWDVKPEEKVMHIYLLFKIFERYVFLGEYEDESMAEIES